MAEFKTSGDQTAFEEIVRRYAGMVFGVCLRTTKNPHDAEDATQAVFLSLAVQCKTGDGVRFVGPWLQQVAKRVSLDIKRSRKRRQTREQRHHAMNGNGNGHTEVEKTGAVDVDELKGVLGEELNQLPSKYRLPLILHYFGGMTRDEMARELNCKPATLGVRIHRGREMLGRRLHERGAAPPGLVLSAALLTEAVRHSVSDALVARTVEAACRLSTGGDLGSIIASNVAAVSKTAAMGALLGAKLKTVAAILLILGVTAMAGGAVAKFAPINLKLPEIFRLNNWIPKLKSPISVPQVNAAPAPTKPQATAPHTTENAPILVANASPIVTSDAPAPSEPVPASRGETASDAPWVAPARPDRLAVASKTVALAPTVSKTHSSGKSQTSSSESLGGGGGGSSDESSNDVVASAAGPAKSGDVVESGAAYLSIASTAGGSGFFGNNGSNVHFDHQDVGQRGHGEFDLNGGSDSFKYLRIGGEPGSSGVFRARGGGSLLVQRPTDPADPSGIVVGDAGSGELIVGDQNSDANVMSIGTVAPGTSEPNLTVRKHPNGSGRIEGRGNVRLGGIFENNGQVVANGFGEERSLEFDGFRRIVNSIENPTVNGTHGWYARDGGRLTLPRIPVSAGTNTYTWGESPDDDTIDLVNSSRITLHDLPDNGFMRISLLALDRGGIPPFPSGHHFIGVWQIDTFALRHDYGGDTWNSTPLEPGGLDITVRYDDALAAQMGLDENVLKLWKYQDGQWIRIYDQFERHPDLHILTGHTDGAIEYYAVSAPEPGAAGLLLIGAGYFLARRSRRVSPVQ